MTESNKDQIEALLREGLDYYGADETGRAILAWEKVLELDPDNAEARDYIETADRRSVPRPRKGEAPPPVVSEAAPAAEEPLETEPPLDVEPLSDAEPSRAGPPSAEEPLLEAEALPGEAALPETQAAEVPRQSAPAAPLSLLDEARARIDDDDYEGALGFLNSCDLRERSSLEVLATVELVRSQLHRRDLEEIGSLDAVPVLYANTDDIAKFNLPSHAGFVLSLVDGATSVADMISVSGMDPFDALRIVQGLLDVEIVSMRT